MVLNQVLIINIAYVHRLHFYYALSFYTNLHCQKSLSKCVTILTSFECICMEWNNRDPYLFEMCLKRKNRKVITKTCCDINIMHIFCLNSIEWRGLVFSGKHFFFSVPMGPLAVQFELSSPWYIWKVKQGEKKTKTKQSWMVFSAFA